MSILLGLLDALALYLSFLTALYLRFDGRIPPVQIDKMMKILPFVILAKITIYYLLSLYRIIWRYASLNEMIRLLGSTFLANTAVSLGLILMEAKFPRSIYPIVFILDFISISGIRFAIRYFRGNGGIHKTNVNRRVMILGAGEAGVMVLKEIRKNTNLGYQVVCFVDDDSNKKNLIVNGVPVLGGREMINTLVRQYDIDEIVFAIPTLTATEKKKYLDLAAKSGARVKTVPGVYEIIDGRVEMSEIRSVSIEDLLGREEVQLDEVAIEKFIMGKRVLISGGGGSIGSELARQIAGYKPSELVLLDIYENNLYDLQNELLRHYPQLNLHCLIESVRNEKRIESVMQKHRPQIVFHAAAHKHVPLMEASPHSAILNNVFGTYNMARISSDIGVERFVFISTDKAVNPTNVMGATKRLGEMIIQALNASSATEYVAVRFGNVLGSSGSVIPLFKKQIEEGGPITVTHKDIIRYFMTIPEAAKLVLQAGSFAAGGEIFILDMGDPIRIYDLAKNMVRLSGLELGRDIDIEVVGLRPGEKLYEELLLDKERASMTQHNKIFIEPTEVISMDELDEKLSNLWKLSQGTIQGNLIAELRRIVPTYQPDTRHEEI